MSIVNNVVIRLPTSRFGTAGFTLVEMLIYIAFLVVVLAVIISSFLIITQSQEQVKASRALEHSAALALDRIVREIRLSDSIDSDQSQFGVNEGVLTLFRTDGEEVTVSLAEEALSITVDGGSPVDLTHSSVEVERFFLEHIDTQRSEGVRLELSLQVEYQDGVLEQTFYATALSRGSYRE